MPDPRFGPQAGQDSYITLSTLREAGLLTAKAAQRRLQFPESFATKLRVEHTLHGHMGCVNRLAWNSDGTLLASGSDDKRILLWRYPVTNKPPLCIETHHQANIFGVAFLPCRGDRSIVSGAMDFSVQLHHLDHRPQSSSDQVPVLAPHNGVGIRPLIQAVNAHTTVYNCHKGRVKMVDVEPGNPYLFWSASEDGTVRQFDTRCHNQEDYESPNVLLGVKHKARLLDLLALSINKARPMQLAVGSCDPFVRVYDRRMLTTGNPDSHVFPEPTLKMAPPHLCLRNPRSSQRTNTTYVRFSGRGDKLIAAYHGDHAHAFDVSGASPDSRPLPFSAAEAEDGSPAAGRQPLLTQRGYMPCLPTHTARSTGPASNLLPAEAEDAKNEGNRAFFDNDDDAAIWHYTKAIQRAPRSAMLYTSRAAAYLKREWIGDAWAALRDCETAIELDPGFSKAHWRRVHALNALGQLQAAKGAADQFALDFPAQIEEIVRVRQNIADELAARSARAGRRRQQYAAERSRSGEVGPSNESDGGQDSTSSSDSEDDPRPSKNDREGWLREDEPQASSSQPLEQQLAFGDPRIAGQVHRALQRYVGHCNVQTDIKEACFMGGNDELVAAGSDDGNVFIFNAATGRPVHVIHADEDVANCVQPHPTLPVLATSGIESVVKLWQPGEAAKPPPNRALAAAIAHNQDKLKRGTNFFRSVPPRILAALTHNPELLNMLLARARPPAADAAALAPHELSCRMS